MMSTSLLVMVMEKLVQSSDDDGNRDSYCDGEIDYMHFKLELA